jgi:hypothetical protein
MYLSLRIELLHPDLQTSSSSSVGMRCRTPTLFQCSNCDISPSENPDT